MSDGILNALLSVSLLQLIDALLIILNYIIIITIEAYEIGYNED